MQNQVAELEDLVAAVREDVDRGPEFEDDLVSRSAMQEEMDKLKKEVLTVNSDLRSDFRDSIESELEGVRGDILTVEQNLVSPHEDIQMNEKRAENLKESVSSLQSRVKPMWDWFNGEPQ